MLHYDRQTVPTLTPRESRDKTFLNLKKRENSAAKKYEKSQWNWEIKMTKFKETDIEGTFMKQDLMYKGFDCIKKLLYIAITCRVSTKKYPLLKSNHLL